MSPIKKELIQVIDILPEAEQYLLLQVARRFMPDDVATPDDIKAVTDARNEYAAGEVIPSSAINWE